MMCPVEKRPYRQADKQTVVCKRWPETSSVNSSFTSGEPPKDAKMHISF